MPNRQPFLSLVVVVALALSVSLVCVSTAFSQSGRRGQKSTPAPAPTPEPTPKEPDKKEKATVLFIVATDENGFSGIPFSFFRTVVEGCADRLDDESGVKVEVSPREMTRADAVNRAKLAKEGFVVWLQLKVENATGDPTVANNLNQVYIEYTVYAATTAKTATWGHTYQRGYRKGGVVLSPPGSTRGNPGYSEYFLKEAAREAAQRILEALKIGAPPQRTAR